MPHFSPISWFISGFFFYFFLKCFVSIFWWFQNFDFSISQNFTLPYGKKWTW